MSTASATSRNLCILHLSDLHFGKDHGFVTRNDRPVVGLVEVNLAQAIAEDLSNQDISKIDAIIISGDIMTHARWMEHLDDAVTVVDEVRKSLSVSEDRVFIIPGNHDYEWYHEDASGRFVRQILEDKHIQDWSVNFTHEVHYRHFVQRLLGEKWNLMGPVFPIPAQEFTVKLGLLDSCKLVPTSFHEYGYLSYGQIKSVIKDFDKNVSGPEIRLIVLHHHVSSIVPAEPPREHAAVSITLDAGRLLDEALEAGIALVLHGHQHYPCVTRINKSYFKGRNMRGFFEQDIYVLSAGSAGVKSDRRLPNVPNTYSLLFLGLDGSQVRIRAISAAGDPGETLVEVPLKLHVHRAV